MTRVEALKAILAALEAREDARLSYGWYNAYDQCVCAVGAYVEHHGYTVTGAPWYELGQLGLPEDVTADVINVNCRDIQETPEARYARVVSWLKEKVQ